MKRILLTSIILLATHMGVKSQTPNYHSAELITVADLGKFQAIGVSVTSDNRLFVGFPRRGGAYEYGLTEIINGKRHPYPDTKWNTSGGDGKTSFVNVQDLYVDTDDNLWVLDSKPAPGSSIFGDAGKAQQGQFKLLKIDTKTNLVRQIYYFEDLDKSRSALNDVRVDTEKQLAYLSDPGQAGIVVLDLKNGKTRTVLSKSRFTTAKPDVVLSYEGHQMQDKNGKPFSSHVNGIALTRDNRYFYFKPINEYHLYRIETRWLADTSLTNMDLESKVEDMGTTVITHGLEADQKGNIYLTSSIDYSIKYLSPDGVLHTLVQDKRLLWPDSVGIGTDGYLYFSCAQLQKEAAWNDGVNRTQYPYRIYKVKLP